MTENVKLSVWRTPDFVEYDTPIYLAGYVARMDRPPSRGECVRCTRPSIAPRETAGDDRTDEPAATCNKFVNATY
jgi:hypothetical protein